MQSKNRRITIIATLLTIYFSSCDLSNSNCKTYSIYKRFDATFQLAEYSQFSLYHYPRMFKYDDSVLISMMFIHDLPLTHLINETYMADSTIRLENTTLLNDLLKASTNARLTYRHNPTLFAFTAKSDNITDTFSIIHNKPSNHLIFNSFILLEYEQSVYEKILDLLSLTSSNFFNAIFVDKTKENNDL